VLLLQIPPLSTVAALQRHNTENSKQIFPEKELRGYIPNPYIHLIGLPILLQEK
jgi:hypothetical protein